MSRTRLGTIAGWAESYIDLITAAETLTYSDSGKLFYLESSGGAYAVTLPTTLKAGLQYKFRVQEDTPTGAITIAAGSAIIFGNIAEAEVDTSNDGPGSATDTGVSNIIIGTAASKGDWIDFDCDGTSWYIRGLTQLDASITTS